MTSSGKGSLRRFYAEREKWVGEKRVKYEKSRGRARPCWGYRLYRSQPVISSIKYDYNHIVSSDPKVWMGFERISAVTGDVECLDCLKREIYIYIASDLML